MTGVVEEMWADREEQHRQALVGTIRQMSRMISDNVDRLDYTIRDELKTTECDGAFARLREEIKAIEFILWRQGKTARRKAGR